MQIKNYLKKKSVLFSDTDYGKEAIETLLKAMEDHREDFVVIVAGYKDRMKSFLEANPGLKSRFNKTIQFDDYSPEELLSIFKSMCDKNGYQFGDDLKAKLLTHFKEIYASKPEEFGNARYVRNLFEDTITNQATRLSSSKEFSGNTLKIIIAEDLPLKHPNSQKNSKDEMELLKEMIGLASVKKDIRNVVSLMENQKERKRFSNTIFDF